jgi:hypothetical protein
MAPSFPGDGARYGLIFSNGYHQISSFGLGLCSLYQHGTGSSTIEADSKKY